MIALHVKSIEMISNDQSKVSECCGLFPNKDKEKLRVIRKYSAHYTPAFLSGKAFHGSANGKADSPCCISNSSLKETEREGLEDELTAYMKEIQRREQTIYGIHP